MNQGQIMNSDMMTALAEYIATEILSQPNRKIGETEKLISSGYCNLCRRAISGSNRRHRVKR